MKMETKNELDRIKQTLKWVWNNKYSDFYRKKYEKAGIDASKVKNWEDFRKIPFLERREIAQSDPYDRVFLPEKKIKGLLTTSGTSGQEPLVIFNKQDGINYRGRDISFAEYILYEKLKKIGAKRLATFRVLFACNMYCLESSSDNFRVLLDMNNLAASAIVAAKARIDAIETTATTLYFFTPYLKERYDLRNIKYIQLSGEYCSNQKIQLIRRTYPNAVVTRNYGSNEDRVRGRQCIEQGKKGSALLHVASKIKYIECIDPETKESLGYNKEGECVVTVLDKFAFPVIRYRTGDEIIFRKEKCSCGDKSPLFEILGRIGTDSVSIQGGRLTRIMAEKALEKLKADITVDYRFHIYEKIIRGEISYLLEAELVPQNLKLLNNERLKDKIKKAISENLYLSPSLTLQKLVEKGAFLPLEVKLVEQIPFENKRKIFVTHY